MRIGILTFHFAVNYGAVIQTWALQTYLRGCGHDVWIVNYDPRAFRYPWWVSALRKGLWAFALEWRFRFFRKRQLRETVQVKSTVEMESLGLDAYIVGSDQVWNVDFFKDCHGHFNRMYFLPFMISRAKRISYAASIGEGEWGRDGSELASLLNAFDSVSVRECFAEKVVKAYGRADACVVPDPTLLISKSHYLRLAGNERVKHESYRVFVYGLNAADRCFKILKVVLTAHPRAEVRLMKLGRPIQVPDWADIKELSLSPEEWVGEIFSSDLVITDSFHGVAVSVALGKNFYTFLKSEEPNCRDRIVTLLDNVGLMTRLVDVSEEYVTLPTEKIDYHIVMPLLERYRAKGLSFLECALEKKNDCA